MLEPKVMELAEQDGRYSPQAFLLVCEALSYTVDLVKTQKMHVDAAYENKRHPGGDENRTHVSGKELVEGFRRCMTEQYGAMALSLLKSCNLSSTEDIGEIVFLMVEAGVWGRQECDSKAEFADGYQFSEAFAPAAILESEHGA